MNWAHSHLIKSAAAGGVAGYINPRSMTPEQRKAFKEYNRWARWANKRKNVKRVNELLEAGAAAKGMALKDVPEEDWQKLLSDAYVQMGRPRVDLPLQLG